MTLIQIRMSESGTAQQIIEKMVVLLRKRHHFKLSRKGFLANWKKLRTLLSATVEYQAFRAEVISRDHGVCTDCGTPSRTVHHRHPVARAPRLALKVSNGQVKCDSCHVKKHPHMRAKVA